MTVSSAGGLRCFSQSFAARSRLDALNAEIKECRAKIEALNDENKALTERLLVYRSAQPRDEDSIADLTKQIASNDQQIADNRQQIARLDQQLAMEVRRMEQAPGSLELCL